MSELLHGEFLSPRKAPQAHRGPRPKFYEWRHYLSKSIIEYPLIKLCLYCTIELVELLYCEFLLSAKGYYHHQR